MVARISRRVFLAAAAVAAMAVGHGSVAGANATLLDVRAQDLVKKGREAIGSVETLRSLSARGSHVLTDLSSGKSVPVSSPFELYFELPDKYLELTSLVLPNHQTRQVARGFNGHVSLTGTRGLTGVTLDRGRAKEPLRERLEFVRLMLAWLLTSPSYCPVKYAYVGEAEANDGTRTYVIEARGADDFVTRIHLDQATGRPVMLTYLAERTMLSPAANSQTSLPTRGQFGLVARDPLGQEPAAIYLSAPIEAKGFHLASRLIEMRESRTTSQIDITAFVINPVIKPELFDKKTP